VQFDDFKAADLVHARGRNSITDPNDQVSPSLAIAPHWMIMMPFDPKTTGLPEQYSDVGAYAMWSESRTGHLHINGIP
jgi:hypothetical protein